LTGNTVAYAGEDSGPAPESASAQSTGGFPSHGKTGGGKGSLSPAKVNIALPK